MEFVAIVSQFHSRFKFIQNKSWGKCTFCVLGLLWFYQHQELWGLVSLFDSCSQGVCVLHLRCWQQPSVTKLVPPLEWTLILGGSVHSMGAGLSTQGATCRHYSCRTFSLLSDLSALVDLIQLDLVSDSFTNKLSIKAHPGFSSSTYGNLAKEQSLLIPSGFFWLLRFRVLMHAQSLLTLCDPTECSPRTSSVHRIFQARILEWVAISYSRVSSWPRDGIRVSCLGRRILYHWAPGTPP